MFVKKNGLCKVNHIIDPETIYGKDNRESAFPR